MHNPSRALLVSPYGEHLYECNLVLVPGASCLLVTFDDKWAVCRTRCRCMRSAEKNMRFWTWPPSQTSAIEQMDMVIAPTVRHGNTGPSQMLNSDVELMALAERFHTHGHRRADFTLLYFTFTMLSSLRDSSNQVDGLVRYVCRLYSSTQDIAVADQLRTRTLEQAKRFMIKHIANYI